MHQNPKPIPYRTSNSTTTPSSRHRRKRTKEAAAVFFEVEIGRVSLFLTQPTLPIQLNWERSAFKDLQLLHQQPLRYHPPSTFLSYLFRPLVGHQHRTSKALIIEVQIHTQIIRHPSHGVLQIGRRSPPRNWLYQRLRGSAQLLKQLAS